ncbi:MAG: aldo/keto reductase [Anaerolineae bacterium]|jgi:predicted aldo/keto reductase-like oxidoreductase
MQYRKFGKLDWQVSVLGFGCMRLPIRDGDSSNIDEPEAIRMLRYAIDHGVNYLDTAYPYHGGNSERVVGKALQDGYRNKVHLATKLPAWAVEDRGDFDKYLNEQLEKLQTDHIDVYLLHGMRANRWEAMQKYDVLASAEKAKADGRIGHLGFSFHDSLDVFKQVVDGYDDWAMCQIQYNYMNDDYQAGTKGLEYAASRGLAVVVMEPLLGGKLVNPPQPVQALWERADADRSPAEWALTWLWNKPQVTVALSGMSTMQHVKENIASADRAQTGILSTEELALIGQVREKYDELCPIPCTQCRYCMPCPNGVDIPRSFSVFNNGVMYNAFAEARRRYGHMEEEIRASACIQCQECEPKCPQNIPISEWMPLVHEVLGEGRPYEECQVPG